MPDGGTIQDSYVYKRAVRGATAPLIMISGPPGTGKTLSALRLATGLAHGGKICYADTDNGRALFYADDFQFEHLNLHEPFRPMIFEEAARQAQKQGATVLVIDNFMAEHAGPGGLLDWHNEINIRMARGNAEKLESTKMLAWIEPKAAHKRMRERLYQLNMPVILAVGAERKMAMVKQTEGKDRGKTIPVDQGLQPICGQDIPWAMTLSVMLPDVKAPGVPVPIKALLTALKPIIRLDRPIDEATGAAILAWSRGEKGPATAPVTGRRFGEDNSDSKSGKTEPAAPGGQSPLDSADSAPPGGDVPRAGPSSGGDAPLSGTPGGNPPEDPPPPEDAAPGDGAPPGGPPEDPDPPEDPAEARIARKAAEIAELFKATKTRTDHLRLVDDKDTRGSFEWIKKHRRPLWLDVIEPALKASWKRTDPKAAPTQGALIP
jgi:hypothetical protein